jgi:hypothetical protein
MGCLAKKAEAKSGLALPSLPPLESGIRVRSLKAATTECEFVLAIGQIARKRLGPDRRIRKPGAMIMRR